LNNFLHQSQWLLSLKRVPLGAWQFVRMCCVVRVEGLRWVDCQPNSPTNYLTDFDSEQITGPIP